MSTYPRQEFQDSGDRRYNTSRYRDDREQDRDSRNDEGYRSDERDYQQRSSSGFYQSQRPGREGQQSREQRPYNSSSNWEREEESGWQADSGNWSNAGRRDYDDRRYSQQQNEGDYGRSYRGQGGSDPRSADWGYRADDYRQGGRESQGSNYGYQSDRHRQQNWRGDQMGNQGYQFENQPSNRNYDSSFGRQSREGQRTGMGSSGLGYGGSSSYGDSDGNWQRGMHAGRGPKGYQRSDERITEDINQRLTDHDEIDASEIEVQVKDGEVTLTGKICDRQCRRIVEDVVEAVSGVQDISNQLKTKRSTDADSDESESGSSPTSRKGGSKTSMSGSSSAGSTGAGSKTGTNSGSNS